MDIYTSDDLVATEYLYFCNGSDATSLSTAMESHSSIFQTEVTVIR